MGKVLSEIDDDLRAWIGVQKIFFVSTAPLAPDGHVNCSPKGADSLRVLGPHAVAYLDLTGSGAETIAHLRENGRILLMLCAFEGPPRIVRLHGRGEVLRPGEAGFATLAPLFPPLPGIRSIIRVDVSRVSSSCGYSVPLYGFKAPREALNTWAAKQGEEGIRDYWRRKNRKSIDGLPAVED